MSLADFSVTVDDVVQDLPIVAESLGPDMFLSEADIEEWIQEAESSIAEMLRSQGKEISQLNADQVNQVERAVEAYAVAEALDKLGAVGNKYDRFREKWESIESKIRANDDEIGDAPKNGVVTNISDKTPHTDFRGVDYEF